MPIAQCMVYIERTIPKTTCKVTPRTEKKHMITRERAPCWVHTHIHNKRYNVPECIFHVLVERKYITMV